MAMMKNYVIRRNLFIMIAVWFTSILSWYMIVFYMKYIPGNIYENSIAVSSADTMGYVLTGFMFEWIGLTSGCTNMGHINPVMLSLAILNPSTSSFNKS